MLIEVNFVPYSRTRFISISMWRSSLTLHLCSRYKKFENEADALAFIDRYKDIGKKSE